MVNVAVLPPTSITDDGKRFAFGPFATVGATDTLEETVAENPPTLVRVAVELVDDPLGKMRAPAFADRTKSVLGVDTTTSENE